MQDRFRFRAKLKEIDNWIYGAYLKMLPYQPYPVGKVKPLEKEYKHLIIVEGNADWGMSRGISSYEVIPETVGQCTGLKDKNGKLIYEGDIIENPFGAKHLIEWFKDGFWINGFTNGAKWELRNLHKSYEVIGNIYENADLLKVRNK